MKNLSRLLLSSFLLAAILTSCKKDENKVSYAGGTNPVLTANKAVVSMSYITKDNEALTLNWTNPNYMFTTGISSQNVSYVLEIDTTGSNFTSAKRQTIAVSKDLTYTLSQSTLNDYLLNQLILVPDVPHNVEFRVTSTLNGSVALRSNTMKFVITPFSIPPKVAPPTSGHLFLVGSATAGGWNNPVPVPTQEFTKVSNTVYEITVPLSGGNEYLMLPVNGDWSHKYAVKTSAGGVTNTGGDFGYDLSDNFPGPAASGNYKIQADFQRGKFTVTKL